MVATETEMKKEVVEITEVQTKAGQLSQVIDESVQEAKKIIRNIAGVEEEIGNTKLLYDKHINDGDRESADSTLDQIAAKKKAITTLQEKLKEIQSQIDLIKNQQQEYRSAASELVKTKEGLLKKVIKERAIAGQLSARSTIFALGINELCDLLNHV